MSESSDRPVIVTTERRGVFFGYTSDPADAKVVTLRNARCAIRWGTTGGWLQLAATGPTANSKVGTRAPEITLQGVTSVAAVSPEAAAAWERA